MVVDNSDDATEEWRGVRGFEDCYQVSSAGRLRRIKAASRAQPGAILGNYPRKDNGYVQNILVSAREGKRASVLRHSIVADSFLWPRPDGFQINHKNRDKLDNRLENLEYVTPGENSRHAIRTGTPNCKLALQDREAIQILGMFFSQASLARAFGIDPSAISRIINGEILRLMRSLQPFPASSPESLA
jgi:hypothetical protein